MSLCSSAGLSQVRNEPENSLHPDPLPPLARLIQAAAQRTKGWVIARHPTCSRASAKRTTVGGGAWNGSIVSTLIKLGKPLLCVRAPLPYRVAGLETGPHGCARTGLFVTLLVPKR